MIARVLRALVFLCLVLSGRGYAHEIRPAYLRIDERAPLQYDVLWKVPSNGGRVLDIQPRFADGLTATEAELRTLLDGFVVYQLRVQGERGLPGTEVRIEGLEQTAVDVLMDVTLLDGSKHTRLLYPTASSATIPEVASAWDVVRTYTVLGVEHILLGVDHLLFVLSLMLVVAGWRALVKTVTAFTVAHSVTLALVALGHVALPSGPVEVLIALSIVLVCAEAVRVQRGGSSLGVEGPWRVAFVFGLLHGCGFAGALLDLGLPQGETPLALLFFNVGVELGQLAFVAGLLALGALVRRVVVVPRRAPVATAYAAGIVAASWFFERLYGSFA